MILILIKNHSNIRMNLNLFINLNFTMYKNTLSWRDAPDISKIRSNFNSHGIIPYSVGPTTQLFLIPPKFSFFFDLPLWGVT